MSNWKCSCGVVNYGTVGICRKCNTPIPYDLQVQLQEEQRNQLYLYQQGFQQQQQQQQAHMSHFPYPTNPNEWVNKGGKTCPRCGITNSSSTTGGIGIILFVILFVTCIGLLFIPFLPKTWYCRHCGYTW